MITGAIKEISKEKLCQELGLETPGWLIQMYSMYADSDVLAETDFSIFHPFYLLKS